MIRLEAVTLRDFHPAIADASSAIGSCGGWVVDHQFYSNMMAMLAFEVPADHIATLIDKLAAAQIKARSLSEPIAASPHEIKGQLTITFQHSNPDLRRTVPAFG